MDNSRLVMSIALLNAYMNEKLDSTNQVCLLNHSLKLYQETVTLLRAVGHDATDLEQAIHNATEAIAVMKHVNQIACAKFKAEGVKFQIVSDESLTSQVECESVGVKRRKELE